MIEGALGLLWAAIEDDIKRAKKKESGTSVDTKKIDIHTLESVLKKAKETQRPSSYSWDENFKKSLKDLEFEYTKEFGEISYLKKNALGVLSGLSSLNVITKSEYLVLHKGIFDPSMHSKTVRPISLEIDDLFALQNIRKKYEPLGKIISSDKTKAANEVVSAYENGLLDRDTFISIYAGIFSA